MGQNHENDVKLAVLETEVKNLTSQIAHLNEQIKFEREARTERSRMLFQKLDDIRDGCVSHDEFKGIKKKSTLSKKSSGARLARWPYWSLFLGLFGK